MGNLREKKLPLLRMRMANVEPVAARLRQAEEELSAQNRLEREILDISDREKERVGRELHDGLCQNLAGIAALSATLSRKLAVSSDPAAADAAEITRLLNETIG